MRVRNNISRRLVIYPKDIEIILGRKRAAASELMSKMRKALNKNRHQYITIREFCEFTGIEEELVRDLLND